MNSPENIELETTDCPLCGAGNGLTTRFDFKPYRLARCAACGLYYCATRLTAKSMTAFYARHDYFEGQGYDSYAAQEPALRLTFRRFLKQLNARFPLHGALLEVGCGYGYLLDEARPYFQRRAGTDFSPQAVKQAAGSGAEIHQGDIEGLPHNERYDCIILAHVIEHVYRPVPLMRAIREKLKAGGVVAVATPNIGSLWFPLMGRKWSSFKIPEHVAFYNRRTLHRLLVEAGFSDIRPVPYLHAFPLALIANKLGDPKAATIQTPRQSGAATVCSHGALSPCGLNFLNIKLGLRRHRRSAERPLQRGGVAAVRENRSESRTRMPAILGGFSCWIPGTTVAMAARK